MALADVLKAINKKFDTNVAQIGVPELQKRGTLSLGSPSLDYCLYNSLPEGTWIEFNGLEGSGKTLVSFLVASSYIKRELKRNPDAPRKILFVDTECACDPDWALRATGYDMNSKEIETIYIQSTGQSAEEMFDIVRECVATGEIGLVIFDSLSMLAGNQVNNEKLDKEQMGGIAKPLTNFNKRTTGLLNKYKCTFIGISGLYDNISGYGAPSVSIGGRQWKRSCMVRVLFKRGAPFDEEGNELKASAQSPAGHIIEMYVEKTKVCKWDRKLGVLHLNYDKGVDLVWDTITTATALGLIKRINTQMYGLVNDDGEVYQQFRGEKNIKPFLEEHPELWRQLYDKCYEKLAIKDDPNAVAFEKMLNIDMSPEALGFDINKQSEEEELVEDEEDE